MTVGKDARPGILLYYEDVAPFATALTPTQLGELLLALLRYGQDGIEPDGLDKLTALAFAVLRAHVDRDGQRYTEIVLSRKYAAYCAKMSREGGKALCREDWERQFG